MNLTSWSEVLSIISQRVAGLLPNLVAGAGLLLAGWIVAVILRRVCRGLVGAALGRFAGHELVARGLAGSELQRDVPRVIGAFAYWVTLFFFTAAAAERLQLSVVTELLRNLAYYLPNVLIAVLVVFLGLAVGGLVNQWITGAAEAAQIEYSRALGRVAQGAVVLAALVVGAQQAGIESGFFTTLLSIGFAATLGGMALAFGIGSGPIVSNIMASYYAAKAYRIGDVVRVGAVEGTVREINPTSIVLVTAEGIVHLPAKRFCDEASIVLGETE